MNNLCKQVSNLFRINADEENAKQMSRYLKNKFEFYGIKQKLRSELEKPFLQKQNLPPLNDISNVVNSCWEHPKREMQFFALDFLTKYTKQMNPDHLYYFEGLVQQKSWWDTVDYISTRLSGEVLKRFPNEIESFGKRWVEHNNMWVNRMGILFQLKYKENSNQTLLFNACLRHAKSKEFFIQKVIGWVLREYGKTYPNEVEDFINKNNFAPLSVREGLRIIKANK
jgi:3-methyladenine DNA glycosylase AlkD